MKYILLFAWLCLSTLTISAQDNTGVDMDEHKIVFQLTSADTTVHKMLLRQLGNMLAAAPNSRMEVVCHGPGITMMQAELTIVHPKVMEMKSKGIEFVVCENTLRERKVTMEEIVPEASFVRAGILEIVRKQEQGWSYIRAGQ
jgi:intracellular sulfur oxidation DsrE/DsrF family protein